jgi:hypothetical protein
VFLELADVRDYPSAYLLSLPVNQTLFWLSAGPGMALPDMF